MSLDLKGVNLARVVKAFRQLRKNSSLPLENAGHFIIDRFVYRAILKHNDDPQLKFKAGPQGLVQLF